MPTAPAPQQTLQIPTPTDLFLLFCRVGMTSFGGGTSSWLFHEIVHRKRWVAEPPFLEAWALCQALPGINVTNLAVWMGRHLCGWRGALSALAGIIVFPSLLIVIIAALFSIIANHPWTEIAMTGATAAAVSLPFSMGITLARRVPRAPLPLLITLATFLSVGVFKLPLIDVVLVLGGLGVAGEYFPRKALPEKTPRDDEVP